MLSLALACFLSFCDLPVPQGVPDLKLPVPETCDCSSCKCVAGSCVCDGCRCPLGICKFLGYTDAYKESLKTGKPLAVFVGGAAPRHVSGCLVTSRESLPGVSGRSVAIGVPHGDSVYFLPERALPCDSEFTVRKVSEEVKAAKNSLPKPSAPAAQPTTRAYAQPQAYYGYSSPHASPYAQTGTGVSFGRSSGC